MAFPYLVPVYVCLLSCTRPFDFCADHNCNGGYCVNSFAGPVCMCSNTGHIGPNCATRPDAYCGQAQCYNGGTCVNGSSVYNQLLTLNFKCICPEGYEGPQCERRIDYCANLNCGSRCYSDYKLKACLCKEAFGPWPYCNETMNMCQSGPGCSGKIGCVDRWATTPMKCSCQQGYSGDTCSNPACGLVSCHDRGSCSVGDGSWQCTCRKYYYGLSCDINPPCGNSKCGPDTADCTEQLVKNLPIPKNYSCSCRRGYQQAVDVDGSPSCDSMNDCMNLNPTICTGSQCDRQEGGFKCVCFPQFTGEMCVTPMHGVNEPAVISVTVVAAVLAVAVVAVLGFAMTKARRRRAHTGLYCPKKMEEKLDRLELNSIIKAPPEERLI